LGPLGSLPPQYALLFTALEKKAREWDARINEIGVVTPPTVPTSIEEEWACGAFYSERYRRRRPPVNYAANKRANNQRFSGGSTDQCRKYVHHTTKLTPGIFVVMCPHGIIVAFEFLQEHESPRHAFDFLYNRLEIPNSTSIYDNHCHGMKYCMAREPGFFKNHQFFIDRMHWTGDQSFSFRIYHHILIEYTSGRYTVYQSMDSFMICAIFSFIKHRPHCVPRCLQYGHVC
jgi:hypothetical protein